MAIPDEIFRSYDVRGTTDQLSEDLAYRIGAAVVKLTGAKCVAVGRDMRPTSPAFAQAVMRGITDAGADAVDIGMCSTPMFNFAVFAYPEHEAGVMVTASHNPAQYNGFKMSHGDAMPISGAEIKPLVLADLPKAATAGSVSAIDVSDAYVARLLAEAKMPPIKGMKVAVDAGNGMAGVILPKLFAKLDAEFFELYFEPDGTFPNHEANPIKLETLRDLQKLVAEKKADLGVALDGDADRVGFVDENGVFVNGDVMLAVLATDRLKAHPGGDVVWSPNASWAIRDAILASNGKSVWEKVGRTNIIKRVQRPGVAVGGEVSAHYFYPEFGGMESTEFTLLLLLKMLAQGKQPFSKLLAPFRRYATSGEINFEVHDKAKVLAALEAAYRPQAADVNTLDGFRFEFADWWFNVRQSNTEPLIRLNLEATSRPLMEAKRDEVAAFIKQNG